MKPVIVNEAINPYMKRKELVLSVDHFGGATPSIAGVQKLISDELGVQPEQVDIKNIFSYRGKAASKVKVFIWEEPKVADLSKPKEQPAQAEPAEKQTEQAAT